MTIQEQIDDINSKLSKTETAYAHAMALGTIDEIYLHRREITKYRNQIEKLTEERMAK